MRSGFLFEMRLTVVAQENTGERTSNTATEDRSVTDNIKELTTASKELLDAGKKMADNLSEITEKVEHAKNVGSDALKSPWVLVAASIFVGVLLVTFSGRD